jgi:hypothetical protein
MSDKKLGWLYDLINFGGAVTGIILTAIGGTMLLNASLKLYVFKFDSNEYSYIRAEDCRYDYLHPVPVEGNLKTVNTQPRERTSEEIEKCMDDRKAEEKQRYTRNKQENMVDGLAMLIIGIPFWVIFDRRRQFSLGKKK